MLDAWIYCTPAAWDALAPDGSEPWVKPYREAITGFWKTWDGTHEVYNTIGSESDVTALVNELAPAVARVFAWTQGDGLDNQGVISTIPANVLAVMKDHEDTTPATHENPNWGHLFLGQRERVFAGEWSNEFNEEFF
jgi:malate synthase